MDKETQRQLDAAAFLEELEYLTECVERMRATAERMTGSVSDCGRSREIVLCSLADESITLDRKIEQYEYSLKQRYERIVK